MNNKEITIKGKQYPVAFNMKTMINFEEIADKSFFSENFKHMRDQIALILAAVLSADDKTALTVDDLTSCDSQESVMEVITAFAVVMDMAEKFFENPAVEPKDEKPADGEGAKN